MCPLTRLKMNLLTPTHLKMTPSPIPTPLETEVLFQEIISIKQKKC